ncbi:protein prune homolog 2-like [Liolophura sinensis]|uniref:protein prune homolog 2-like n=1 Tax=Liolophura sinensis TaxID=3198878 RepID=UPI00315926A0
MAGEGSDCDTSPGDDDDSSISSVDTDPLDENDDLEILDVITPDAFGMAPEREWESYYGESPNAMIVFSGCYFPERSRKDYSYVMENLFFYVIGTLELLVAENYLIVYFHGATPRRQTEEEHKRLVTDHPTMMIKAIIMMSKPFFSSKFCSKLKIVKTLAELETLVSMAYAFVYDQVREVNKVARLNPAAIEKGFNSPDDLSSATASPLSPSSSGRKKTKASSLEEKEMINHLMLHKTTICLLFTT